jgi:hypothetical protein
MSANHAVRTPPAHALAHDIDAAWEQALYWHTIAGERHQAVLLAIAAHVEALDRRDEWRSRQDDLRILDAMRRDAERRVGHG